MLGCGMRRHSTIVNDRSSVSHQAFQIYRPDFGGWH